MASIREQYRTWLRVKDNEAILKNLREEETVSHSIIINWWSNTKCRSGVGDGFLMSVSKDFVIEKLEEVIADGRAKLTFTDEEFLEIIKDK